MFDFYQKRKLRGLLTAPLTRIILFSLFVLLAWAAFTRYQIAADMEARRIEAEQEMRLLQEQKETLSQQVQYLSDERGIEAEMRRQFDVALKDEQVVVIVDPEQPESERNSTSTTYSTEDDKAWYEFWR